MVFSALPRWQIGFVYGTISQLSHFWAKGGFVLTKEGEPVHVALSIHDPDGGYSRHSGVVMASIFERTESPVCVHILHDETMTEKNRSFLREVSEVSAQRNGKNNIDFMQRIET
jgi:hypothetical protein